MSWTVGTGALTYVTVLQSYTGQSKCHTHQNHCLLGCITCGVNYTVAVKAVSATGLTADCAYQSYSSSKWNLDSSSRVSTRTLTIIDPDISPSMSFKSMLHLLHQACMINSDYFLKCLQFSSWFRTSKLRRLLLVHAKSLQLCLTLCDPLDYSLPGFSVHGTVALYPTRLLFPWDSPGKNPGVGCHFLQGSSQPRDQICVSCLLHWWVGSLPLAPPGKPFW